MTITKIIAVATFGVFLTGCAQQSAQMQIDGAKSAVAPVTNVEHRHYLPDGAYVTHSHENGGDTSHTHTMSEVRNAMRGTDK